jgi:hypothetical protein
MFFFLPVLEFELRASLLLGRKELYHLSHSTSIMYFLKLVSEGNIICFSFGLALSHFGFINELG